MGLNGMNKQLGLLDNQLTKIYDLQDNLNEEISEENKNKLLIEIKELKRRLVYYEAHVKNLYIKKGTQNEED